MQSSSKRQTGFTLTEMAIVIVLGGILLSAGLMAGRGQISRAQTQDVIQVIGDLQTGAASFKQRYGYLPGDMPAPGNVLTGAVAGTGGTIGNGLVEGAVSAAGAATAGTETAQAPNQLFLAGLISKLTSDPTQYVKTQFGAAHIRSATAAVTSAAYFAAYPAVKNVIVLYGLPCEVATEVDLALDDGAFGAGRSQGIFVGPNCVAGNTLTRYWVPL